MAFQPGDPVLELEAAGHGVPAKRGAGEDHWYRNTLLRRLPISTGGSIEHANRPCLGY